MFIMQNNYKITLFILKNCKIKAGTETQSSMCSVPFLYSNTKSSSMVAKWWKIPIFILYKPLKSLIYAG